MFVEHAVSVPSVAVGGGWTGWESSPSDALFSIGELAAVINTGSRTAVERNPIAEEDLGRATAFALAAPGAVCAVAVESAPAADMVVAAGDGAAAATDDDDDDDDGDDGGEDAEEGNPCMVPSPQELLASR